MNQTTIMGRSITLKMIMAINTTITKAIKGKNTTLTSMEKLITIINMAKDINTIAMEKNTTFNH